MSDRNTAQTMKTDIKTQIPIVSCDQMQDLTPKKITNIIKIGHFLIEN